MQSYRRYLGLCAAVLLAIAAIGFEHVAYPFHGDQALFALGAQKIHDGSTLYRDFWDLKQPGIYYFYLAGGELFGFTERGIHLFELLYLLIFAAVLQITLRPYFRRWFISAVIPLLIVGISYANASSHSLTQVEAVVGFPLYLSLYFAALGTRRQLILPFAAAGFFGAVALSFKLIFLPMLAGIWLAVLLTTAGNRDARRYLGAQIAVLCASFVVCNAVWIAAISRMAGAELVYNTFVRDPIWISKTVPSAPLSRLVEAVGRYAASILALIALTVAALWDRRRILRNEMIAGCVLWLVGGFFVIVLQRQSWWDYHLHLLTVPFGILAGFGIETVLDWTAQAGGAAKTQRIAAACVIGLVLMVLPILHSVKTTMQLARSHLALNAQSQQKFRELVDASQARTSPETAFLRRGDAVPGSIYVFGDPLYYLAAGRTQTVAINGWSLELLLPEEWQRLGNDLAKAPPSYVFVTNGYRDLIREREPSLAAYLQDRYRPIQTDPGGVWYARAEHAVPVSKAS